MKRVLVIDDDPAILDSLTEALEMEEFSVVSCESGEKALEAFGKDIFDAVITDLDLPGINGMQVLQEILTLDPHTIVIIITGHASIETAIEALRLGADDYLRKPFNMAEVPIIIEKVLKMKALERDNRSMKEELRKIYGYKNIIGKSPKMKQVFETIALVAESDATILITGDSGTGKELIAKAIHYNSARKKGPLVSINTSAIPDTLLEDELFGHDKGAFTGASNAKPGRFERAHGGTLFLDEIGYMSPSLQVKLLRVLQEREFERVGGTKTIKVDVRIIAATSANLEQAIQEKKFRQDLYYRINVVQIRLPPLRERREDIPLLANFFIKKLAQERGLAKKELSKESMRLLFHYDWPGNIRELENCIERAILLSGQKQLILPEHLNEPIQETTLAENQHHFEIPEQGIDLKNVVCHVEANYIQIALQKVSGVKSNAAKILGIKRTTLIEKIKKNPFLSD
ncbi:sigma-54-dependent transcriptional regulator [candidate division CSSED10-310 bacterium]|uniref:Sigma-54-dependent transcriptional regulator n=1 Tax=candidate division CSSED10-310 bacterium TaxID=2855610 RepID=A0ABV6YYW1_UNCC1